MKQTIHIILLVFAPFLLKSQTIASNTMESSKFKWAEHPDSTEFSIDISADYFLIGTLNGYLGRKYYNTVENSIDQYKNANQLKNYIYNFVQEYYQITPDTTERYYLKSPIVAKKINSYFDQEGKITLIGFKNESETYSYILGKYLRYGEHLKNNIYKIQLVNSFEGNLVYRSLKDLGCDNILYKNYRGYIPTSQFYYFEATPRMIKLFNTFTTLKEAMKREYLTSFIENKSYESIEKDFQEFKEREYKKVEIAFSK